MSNEQMFLPMQIALLNAWRLSGTNNDALEHSLISKSLSRKVCSLGSHICNASGQLKQDQALNGDILKSQKLLTEHAIKLNCIFQISKKI